MSAALARAFHVAYVQLAQKRPDGLRGHVKMRTRQPYHLVPAANGAGKSERLLQSIRPNGGLNIHEEAGRV